MPKPIDVSSYAGAVGVPIVVDTNVWLHVHAQDYKLRDKDKRRAAPYTRAIKELMASRAPLVLLDVVMSEFVSGMERDAARYWQKNDGKLELKTFRREGPRADAITTIRRAVAMIVRASSFGATLVDESTLDGQLQQFDELAVDLNDVLIAQYCVQNDCHLLTDDSDMLKYQDLIQIATAQV